MVDEPVIEAEPCVHHWDIAPPKGPTSVGVCRKCMLAREFRNSLYTSDYTIKIPQDIDMGMVIDFTLEHAKRKQRKWNRESNRESEGNA